MNHYPVTNLLETLELLPKYVPPLPCGMTSQPVSPSKPPVVTALVQRLSRSQQSSANVTCSFSPPSQRNSVNPVRAPSLIAFHGHFASMARFDVAVQRFSLPATARILAHDPVNTFCIDRRHTIVRPCVKQRPYLDDKPYAWQLPITWCIGRGCGSI